jgi:hypothetical protein
LKTEGAHEASIYASSTPSGARRWPVLVVALELAVGALRAIDPDLGRLIAGEVGPPACSVVSASNQLAFDANEGNIDSRARHEGSLKPCAGRVHDPAVAFPIRVALRDVSLILGPGTAEAPGVR